MPAACIKVDKSQKNSDEYYLNLIANDIAENIIFNAINYIKKLPCEEQKNEQNAAVQIILRTNFESEIIPSQNKGIYVIFNSGIPEAKRLATILTENLKNIYYDNLNIKIIAQNHTSYNNLNNLEIRLGNCSNKQDMEWLKNNIEEVARNITMSLCEHFALPFTTCKIDTTGITVKDTNIFTRPSLNSIIKANVNINAKISILSQWENWYIVEKNGILGYIQTKQVAII